MGGGLDTESSAGSALKRLAMFFVHRLVLVVVDPTLARGKSTSKMDTSTGQIPLEEVNVSWPEGDELARRAPVSIAVSTIKR